MPEATHRRVRFVMYDASDQLRLTRKIPGKLRSLFRDLIDLQLIEGGPILADPVWIARVTGEALNTVRAQLPRLIAAMSESGLGSVSDASERPLIDVSAASEALRKSSNYLENKKTGRERARETPSESINKKINAREDGLASPRKRGSPASPAKNGKVVPLRAPTPSEAQAKREAETAARREAEAQREAQAEAARIARWAATVRDRKMKRRLKRLEQQAIFLRYNHPELLKGYWEATQFGPEAEPFDRRAWATAVRQVARLARHRRGTAA
jgi:hypothetical protein